MAVEKAEPVQKRTRTKRSPIGAPPGTLIADPTAPQPALTLTGVAADSSMLFENASLETVRHCRAEWPLVWIDCVGLGNVDLIRELGTIFGLHPLALEDTVNTSQRPKADFYDDHAYVVMRMIDHPTSRRWEQISVFFGDNFVITFQERAGDPFAPVRKRIEATLPNRLRTRKADYLAYALIDAIVDSYFGPIETIGDQIDHIEDEMLAGPRKHHLRDLHLLRREVVALKRALWPLRDALAALTRADAPYIHRETAVYFNDTLDHSVRLIDAVDTDRELLTELLDTHNSLSQARVSEVISILTIVSSIFIPLTFLAGIWGMNFDPQASPWNMPELEWSYGYPAALAFMLFVALALLGYFKWRKWL
ncbi:magnesium/cobalt transporter CorA [Mesorhizobium australicum]|uniref:Magnesium transport protein CorA n=1 Tax=Mesorhizobium australicum TaxID=536018 RepID=A0A1X7NEA5_9HYPH|nr:magnesium/cobalt transporter CorA [Mesorhizobium australicum]SMH35360.1 magnesium transporter [Mesorhizobium australicum]